VFSSRLGRDLSWISPSRSRHGWRRFFFLFAQGLFLPPHPFGEFKLFSLAPINFWVRRWLKRIDGSHARSSPRSFLMNLLTCRWLYAYRHVFEPTFRPGGGLLFGKGRAGRAHHCVCSCGLLISSCILFLDNPTKDRCHSSLPALFFK